MKITLINLRMNITSQQNRKYFSANSNGSKKKKKKKLSALNTEHFHTIFIMAPQYYYVNSLHDQATNFSLFDLLNITKKNNWMLKKSFWYFFYLKKECWILFGISSVDAWRTVTAMFITCMKRSVLIRTNERANEQTIRLCATACMYVLHRNVRETGACTQALEFSKQHMHTYTAAAATTHTSLFFHYLCHSFSFSCIHSLLPFASNLSLSLSFSFSFARSMRWICICVCAMWKWARNRDRLYSVGR